MKLEEVIAYALQLPPESRRRLVQALIESAAANQVRDAGGSYGDSNDQLRQELIGMKSVIVVLPDDLAKQAQAAGLLNDEPLEELIRRALKEQGPGTPSTTGSTRQRQLVRQHGRLVVESLPGEQPITDTEVRDLLNKMEW